MPLPSKLPSNTATITPLPLLPSLERFLFSAISSAASHPQIKQIHSLILRLHLHRSNLLATKLLRRLSDLKVPFSPYHSLIFSHVPLPNSFLWTSLIRCSPNPFTIYSSMRRHCPPLSFTLSYLLKSSHSLQTGTQIHAQSIFIGGFDADLFVQNTLIDFYVRCCRLDSASRVFDEMSVRDVISWTALIVAYSRSGDMASAEALFRGFNEKDEVVWTAMVTGYAQNARPGEALETFRRMQSAGVTIDDVSLTGAVSAAAQLGVVRHAEFIRDAIDGAGIAWRNNAFVGSAMIDMYAKCGLIADACEVFNCMAERNVYSYSAMIAGLAAHGRANEAISLFEEMVGGTPIRPNSVTFIGLLTACSHAGKADEGQYYFDLMKDEYGVTPSPDHYTCMVDLLGRTGLVEKALELVQSMPVEPHGGVWGSLLASC